MKLGFTVGVWDLLHHGHVNFLKKAKTYCDYLIVGIMNDYWVKVQKGQERPIQNLKIRYKNLKKSKLCDKIIILNTLDMSQYLQICDLWIKGELQKNMKPFKFKNITIIKRTPGISTSILIEKEKINE